MVAVKLPKSFTVFQCLMRLSAFISNKDYELEFISTPFSNHMSQALSWPLMQVTRSW